MNARRIEVLLWTVGLVLLAVYGGTRAWSAYMAERGLAAMREAQAAYALETHSYMSSSGIAGASDTAPALRSGAPDTTMWSAGRRAAYHESADANDVPRAVLRIPALRLQVPVYAGTSESVLNKGAGLIEGTALPGEAGNIGIAAHRDGFFRTLRDISAGDELFVDAIGGATRYRVTDLQIVSPHEVSVLEATERPSVTLVTCYPFYFVGAAPQRFIVRAELAD